MVKRVIKETWVGGCLRIKDFFVIGNCVEILREEQTSRIG